MFTMLKDKIENFNRGLGTTKKLNGNSTTKNIIINNNKSWIGFTRPFDKLKKEFMNWKMSLKNNQK